MDQAGQKGTGLWTVVTALQMGASVPTIYASLNGRVMSSMKEQRVKAEDILKDRRSRTSIWALRPMRCPR